MCLLSCCLVSPSLLQNKEKNSPVVDSSMIECGLHSRSSKSSLTVLEVHGSFPNQYSSVLWTWRSHSTMYLPLLQYYGVLSPLLRAIQSLYKWSESLIFFSSSMLDLLDSVKADLDLTSSDFGIMSTSFPNLAVLLALSSHDLQLALDPLYSHLETWKNIPPQVKVVLFTSGGKTWNGSGCWQKDLVQSLQ